MSDEKNAETTVVEKTAETTVTTAPPPAKETVPPGETGKVTETVVEKLVEKPAEKPVTETPVSKVEPVKLTLKSVKVPDGSLVPSEDLQEIVSTSKTAEEAQQRIDLAHKTIQKNVSRMDANNQKWLDTLRNDPAVGGENWEENKKLYVKTVVERYGENFAKIITALKIDSEPGFVKEVLRQAKMTQAKPLVEGEPLEVKKTAPKSPEEWANNYYKMDPNKKVAAKDRAPRW